MPCDEAKGKKDLNACEYAGVIPNDERCERCDEAFYSFFTVAPEKKKVQINEKELENFIKAFVWIEDKEERERELVLFKLKHGGDR